MELVVNGNVTITVELGVKTLALLSGGAVAPAKTVEDKSIKELRNDAKENLDQLKEREAEVAKETPKPEPKKEAPKKEEPKVEAKKPAPKKETADDSYELGDEAKLEELKTLVTKNTKKGKSADIKFMLAQLNAGRASELATDDYDTFYDAITRYMKGEAPTDIFPAEDLA